MTPDPASSPGAEVDEATPRLRVVAIVLAAGSATRFGGQKLSASLEGRPLLRHVLDVLAAVPLEHVVVVTPPTYPEWLPAVAAPTSSVWIAVNPDPAAGLASSLRVGLEHALEEGGDALDGVLIVLGDQPRLDPAVVRAVLGAAARSPSPIVAPRYDDGGRNPVLVRRSAFDLLRSLEGDRGLGPFIEDHPDLVDEVPVSAVNPDVDTRADLVALAAAGWAERVRRNREQVDRLREAPDGADFYAKVSDTFRDDPDRVGDPVLDALLVHARPDETWLDIGSGAGRYALPLARRVREVIAVDPSPAMLSALRDLQVEHAIDNVRPIPGRWPPDRSTPEGRALADALGPFPCADVALIAHVSYDIEEVLPFVDAMEAAARRLCVAILMERTPAAAAEPFWPEVHGEPRIPLPALPSFVELLEARGRHPEVVPADRIARRWRDRDQVAALVRRQLWVTPGSAKDARAMELVDRWVVPADDGGLTLSNAEPSAVGVVTWSPR
jgi:CTP:molybdopterin cytidylyltransferase MocA/SAM-dependent methyltransferase